jgi:signal transduction histidine kinase
MGSFDPVGTSHGLGMTLVSVLASQLHGEVTAGANPIGRGACFTLTFPAI